MPTLTTLANFNANNGADPDGSLITDAAGDLFGTTLVNGSGGDGNVFEIAKSVSGYASTPTILASFNGTAPGGDAPHGGMIADSAGDLLGTTSYGGADGYGTVFEIAKTATGYAAPTTLASFDGPDQGNTAGSNGGAPKGNLVADATGDLFGTTSGYGPGGGGTVFEIAKIGAGYASTPTTLVSFSGINGYEPVAGLITDSAGDLFGTTSSGGTNGYGTVFEIAKTGTGYASTPTILVNFNYANGSGINPLSGLIMDSAGDLFGTTSGGGKTGGVNDDYGTVFEIAKTATGYASTPTTLVSFNGADGGAPVGGLIADAAGDLFGTTSGGGTNGYGTVFEIAKTAPGYASTPTTLLNFNDSDGSAPGASLAADATGDLFGTTSGGGTDSYGTVFELSGTGFQVACYLRGTRIATPAGERAIESLAEGELVLTEAGEARPIVWIGHRHLDCRRHSTPQDVWPVRVRLDAFGPGRPHRDLFLSPDHAVFIDGGLIPVRYLINGATIVQEAAESVTYWHVELDRHNVILAEGLPCETYLDTGNRGAFANGGASVQMQPDFALRIWDAAACAPLVLGGPRLIAAKRRLLAQAACLGHATDGDPGLKVLVDGAAVPADVHGGHWCVRLPDAAKHARLISRAWIPAQMRPDGEDTRSLGIAISGIWLDGREVSLESQGLSAGWHAPERGWRWTNGDAELALTVVRELAFEVAMAGTYWQDEQRRQVRAA